jgi:hypothetical protein
MTAQRYDWGVESGEENKTISFHGAEFEMPISWTFPEIMLGQGSDCGVAIVGHAHLEDESAAHD